MPGCKPGDLAQIIAPAPSEVRGLFVTVLEALPPTQEQQGVWPGQWFNCKYAGFMLPNWRMVPSHAGWLPDAMLRPIRDPGPDAVDQMVRLVGVAA